MRLATWAVVLGGLCGLVAGCGGSGSSGSSTSAASASNAAASASGSSASSTSVKSGTTAPGTGLTVGQTATVSYTPLTSSGNGAARTLKVTVATIHEGTAADLKGVDLSGAPKGAVPPARRDPQDRS